MEEISYISSFNNLYCVVNIYKSEISSNRILLILKGIYSHHTPFTKKDYIFGSKWDHDLINYLSKNTNIVCINSSRLANFDQTDNRQRQNSFEGKIFEQEVKDIENGLAEAIKYLEDSQNEKVKNIHIVAKSFGGTVALGSKTLLSKSNSIIFIGSGCGKSSTTTKPLLQTLYDEETLLENINNFKGYFTHVRGGNDHVVPTTSQEKIVAHAVNTKLTTSIIISEVDHDLETKMGQRTELTTIILKNLLLNNFEVSET
jgi:hypothetical protein